MEKLVLIFENCEHVSGEMVRRDVPGDKKMTWRTSSEFQKALVVLLYIDLGNANKNGIQCLTVPKMWRSG
jgi:hypothetical protein